MKLRRAILIALVAYIVTMVITSIITISTGINMASIATPPLWLCVTSAAVTIIISWLAALIYFQKKSTRRGSIYGFYFGLSMILTGFILDLITWLTLYPGGRSVEGVTQLLHYYETPYFWITVLLVIIVSIIMGAYEYKSK